MRKKILVVLAAAALGQSQALATPAQDLFDQATFYIGFYYNGPAKVAPYRELRKQYQSDLDKACANDSKCGYDKALPVINKIIADLKDPFTEIISPDFDGLVEGTPPSRPTLGITARETTGGLLVSRTNPGEAGEKAGLQRGDTIKSIAGQAATSANLAAFEANAKPAALEVIRAGATQTLNATPEAASEGLKPSLKASSVNGVSVLRIPDFYWDGVVATRVHQLVRRAVADKAKGLVIDLRDTGSGFESEAVFAARAFVEDVSYAYQGRLQCSKRNFSLERDVIARTPEANCGQRQGVAQFGAQFQQATMPVTVVVNRHTTHTGEVMAYLLQRGGKIKIVGETTAGQLGVSGGLPSLDVPVLDLISGVFINVSSDKIFSLDGKAFPSAITPDVVVPEDNAALASGKDPALDKALEITK